MTSTAPSRTQSPRSTQSAMAIRGTISELLLRSTKLGRRTKADMQAIRRAISQVVAANKPMTVRQVFYALTVRGVIAKTEQEYKGTVVRLLTAMRRAGELSYSWISD